MLDAAGNPIPGFTLAEATELTGDSIAQRVRWRENEKLEMLGGKPIRLRFVLSSADVYSFRFR